MDEKQKAVMIAEAEDIEAIRDFFIEWWSVEQLYESEAKAAIAIMKVIDSPHLCDDQRKAIKDLLNQHMIMVEHMKPFAEKKYVE